MTVLHDDRLEVLKGRFALDLVRRHRPVVFQDLGFSSQHDHWKYDIPSEISFGEHELPRRPVAYFWVRHDLGHFYFGYAFYHYLDWSDCPFAKPFGGEHTHDFEGVVIRVPKYLPHHEPKLCHDIVTVCHKGYKRAFGFVTPEIWIESKGHGIHIGSGEGLRIDKIHLISMDSWNKKYWALVQGLFKNSGVQTPKDWHNGDFWYNPSRLFSCDL